MAAGVKHRRPTAKHAASVGGVVLLLRSCHSATAGWKAAGVLPVWGQAMPGGLSAAANAKIRPRLNNVFPRILFFICRVSFFNRIGELISAHDLLQPCARNDLARSDAPRSLAIRLANVKHITMLSSGIM